MSVAAQQARSPFLEAISVGIVSNNGRQKLPTCLDSLARAGFPSDRVSVADVASVDGQNAWLQKEWPEVTVIGLAENRGPSQARNRLIRACRTPFLLLLDNDVELLPETVQELYAALQRDAAATIACPVVVYGDRPDIVQYSQTEPHYLAGEVCNTRQGRRLVDVVIAPAPAYLIRCAHLEGVDLFDERFCRKQDSEFTYRLTLGGRRIVEVGRAVVLHHASRRGARFFRQQLCNGWHVPLKTYQLRTLILITPMLLLHALLQAALLAGKGRIGCFFGAVGDLARRLPALPRDRAAVARTRRRLDAELLTGDDLLVPADLLATGAARAVCAAYVALTRGYWKVVRRILMAGGSSVRRARRVRPAPVPPFVTDRGGATRAVESSAEARTAASTSEAF